MSTSLQRFINVFPDNICKYFAGKKIMLFLRKCILTKINWRKVENIIMNYSITRDENNQLPVRYIQISEFDPISKVIYDSNQKNNFNSVLYINKVIKNDNFALCSFTYLSENNSENDFYPDYFIQPKNILYQHENTTEDCNLYSYFLATLYNGKICNIQNTNELYDFSSYKLDDITYFVSAISSNIYLYNDFGNLIGKCISYTEDGCESIYLTKSDIIGRPNVYHFWEYEEYYEDGRDFGGKTFIRTKQKLLNVDWVN